MKNTFTVIVLMLLISSCRKTEFASDSQIRPRTRTPQAESPMEGFRGLDVSTLEVRKGIYRGHNVSYLVYQGHGIIDGDIYVPLDELEGNISYSVSTLPVQYAWPDNYVFYRLNSSLGSNEITMINDAIAHWQANTNLVFLNIPTAPSVIEFQNANTGSMFSSSIGRNGGVQVINLANWAITGNVIHEIGHAIGLWHEHQRPDRDLFVDVNYNNIQNNASALYQYQIQTNTFSSLNGLDFNSVMLYSSFSGVEIDPSIPSMTRRSDGSWFFAQRNGLSQDDISQTVLSTYPKLITGLGDFHEGSGSAVGFINGNNIPDLILMANDAPAGPNSFRYRIVFDIDNMGNSQNTSSIFSIPGVGDHQDGADCALADINGNGIPDLILMGDDDPSGPNQFRYRIAYDLSTSGSASYYSGIKFIAGTGDFNEGAGVAVADIDNNSIPDIIVMGNDAPAGPNQFRYKVAFNVNSNGDYSYVGQTYALSGVGDHQDASGLAVADMNNNGIPDLIFLGDDDPSGKNQLRYRVAFDLTTSGAYTSVSGIIARLSMGDFAEGAGISVFDIDGNGRPDFVFSTDDAPSGPNRFKYIIGFNPDLQGVTQNWR